MEKTSLQADGGCLVRLKYLLKSGCGMARSEKKTAGAFQNIAQHIADISDLRVRHRSAIPAYQVHMYNNNLITFLADNCPGKLGQGKTAVKQITDRILYGNSTRICFLHVWQKHD